MADRTLLQRRRLAQLHRLVPRASGGARQAGTHTQREVQHIDLYSLLGLDRTAADVDVKFAFRARAKALHHHGRLPSDNVATFRALKQAYSVLVDNKKRATYDACGLGAAGLHVDIDLFHRQPKNGKDVMARAHLPFDTAAFGGVHRLHTQRKAACSECKGFGGPAGVVRTKCPMCRGKRTVTRHLTHGPSPFSHRLQCPTCFGQGWRAALQCKACQGSGSAAEHVSVRLRVPPGADTGTIIKIRGKGDEGTFGGRSGDLYVRCTAEQSAPGMRREGRHLHMDATVPVWAAILGTELSWPHPDETSGTEQRSITVPQGTQHGDTLRLPGRGLRDAASSEVVHGDLYVQVSVDIPKAPTHAMRRAHGAPSSLLDAACTAVLKRLRVLQRIAAASTVA